MAEVLMKLISALEAIFMIAIGLTFTLVAGVWSAVMGLIDDAIWRRDHKR